MILAIFNPGVLLLFAILLVVIVVGALYLQYVVSKDHLTLMKETNQIAEEIAPAVQRLTSTVKSLGPRLHDEPNLAKFFQDAVWNSVKAYTGPQKNLEELISGILESGSYHVHTNILQEKDNWEGNEALLMFSDEGGELPADRVAVKFQYENIPKSWLGLSEDGDVKLCNSIMVYLPQDCGATCSTEVISKIAKITKELPTVEINRPTYATSYWYFHDFAPSAKNLWMNTKKKYPDISPAVLKLSYPSLTSDGTVDSISISKLLDFLPKAWKDNRINVALTGPPNAGKTRLLLMLMANAAKQGCQIVNVKGSLATKMLEDNAIDAFINSDTPVVLVIDEAGHMDGKTLASLNSLMEGLNSSSQLSIVLAYNDLNPITDASTLRKGRIDLSLHVGKLSAEQSKELYEALKKENPTYTWLPLPEGEQTLGEVYALGTKPAIAEILSM